MTNLEKIFIVSLLAAILVLVSLIYVSSYFGAKYAIDNAEWTFVVDDTGIIEITRP